MKTFIITYLILINLVAIIITVYDKIHAKTGKRRVRESTLLLISALFGSVGMYLTMLIIRHKTRKAKFMITLPIMIILQILFIYFISVKYYG